MFEVIDKKFLQHSLLDRTAHVDSSQTIYNEFIFKVLIPISGFSEDTQGQEDPYN